MPRTLTAGKSEQSPSDRAMPYQDDKEALCWSALGDLWLDGKRRAELTEMIAKLDAWLTRAYFHNLAHPDHPEHAQRNGRLAARELDLLALRGELRAIEERAKTLRLTLGKHFDRLKPSRRAELLAGEGWPRETTGEAVAMHFWHAAQQGARWPDGEAPF